MAALNPRFQTLVQVGADPAVVEAIDALVRDGEDSDLHRINVLVFASTRGLDEENVIEAFVHGAKLGLFEMSWNLVCPGCGGVLDANATLKGMTRNEYPCSICAVTYEPTLDDRVEVGFTISPKVRKIAAHDPDSLTPAEYTLQHYFSAALAFPRGKEGVKKIEALFLEQEVLPAGEKIILSMQIPPGMALIFDAVTHGTLYVEAKGEPTRERQELTVAFTDGGASPREVAPFRPGPLRLTMENKTQRRLLPVVEAAGDEFHALMEHRQPYLTAKRVLSNQAFQDLYRADTLDIDQRFKIASLTVLFTDLKGSTELYERVGDLTAYDLVRNHFHVLGAVVKGEGGAVVKTIGDAVMATFPTPDRAISAALKMRQSMSAFNARQQREDLIVKIGMHEGPCLAVSSNERLDYFGQTVNIAARVQGLADAQSIFVTQPVVENADVIRLLGDAKLVPVPKRAMLKGIKDELTVFEIP